MCYVGCTGVAEKLRRVGGSRADAAWCPRSRGSAGSLLSLYSKNHKRTPSKYSCSRRHSKVDTHKLALCAYSIV